MFHLQKEVATRLRAQRQTPPPHFRLMLSYRTARMIDALFDFLLVFSRTMAAGVGMCYNEVSDVIRVGAGLGLPSRYCAVQ